MSERIVAANPGFRPDLPDQPEEGEGHRGGRLRRALAVGGLWFAATVAGAVAGALVIESVLSALSSAGVLRVDRFDVFDPLPVGAAAGQWGVLRARVPRSWRWPAATVAALVAGEIVFAALPAPGTPPAVREVVARDVAAFSWLALSLSVPQYLVLRGRFPGALAWVPTAAWLPALAAAAIVMDPTLGTLGGTGGGPPEPGMVALAALGYGVPTGLVSGAVFGWLVWRRDRPERTAD